jgi:hypothetical protein
MPFPSGVHFVWAQPQPNIASKQVSRSFCGIQPLVCLRQQRHNHCHWSGISPEHRAFVSIPRLLPRRICQLWLFSLLGGAALGCVGLSEAVHTGDTSRRVLLGPSSGGGGAVSLHAARFNEYIQLKLKTQHLIKHY